MRILDIQTADIAVPLKKPFKTALRRVDAVNDILVRVITDQGEGYGEAPPTAVITGDTRGGIEDGVHSYIKPALLGMDLSDLPAIFSKLDACMLHNTSAKAAVDMALYDLIGKERGLPLYRVFGGAKQLIQTDLTLSLFSPEQMAADAREAYAQGYRSLKLKVGGQEEDFARVSAVRQAVGTACTLRVDANQAWDGDTAIRLIRAWEDKGLALELVEQPVPYWDFEGMARITKVVDTPILADEAIFAPRDARRLLDMGGCDLINIKLMKAGGLHNALELAKIAEEYGVQCLMGCMLETKLAVSAAAHFAAGQAVVTRADLDGPGLCALDPYQGGPEFSGPDIRMNEAPGLGITALPELVWR